MRIKSDMLTDNNFHSIVQRCEGVMELMSRDNKIIGVTIVYSPRRDEYQAAIFYDRYADVKEPAVAAKVVAIDGCRFHSAPETPPATPGGCVSVPDQHFADNQKVLQTLSEKLQDDLEPLPNEGKKFCV